MIAIKKGVVSIFVSKIIVGVLGLVMVVLTSRFFGSEGHGEINLFLSSIVLLQMFMDFGSNSSLINLSYKIPQVLLFKSAIIWIFFIAIISYSVILFFDNIKFLCVVPIFATMYSVYNLNNLLLMGQQRVNYRNLLIVMLPLVSLVFFIFFFYYVDLNLVSYPVGLSIGLLSVLSISLFFLKDIFKVSKAKFVFVKEVLTQGFWVQMAHAIQFLNYRLNFFLIALFVGQAALGVYNNAIVLVEAIWILGHSLGQMLHMKILNTENQSEIKRLVAKMMKINASFSMLLFLFLWMTPNSFWVFLFDKDFSDLNLLFPFLGIGVLSFSVSNILNHFFHANNQFKLIVNANLIGLIFGLLSALYLIPIYQLNGASISWSLGLFCSMVFYLHAYFFRKHFFLKKD